MKRVLLVAAVSLLVGGCSPSVPECSDLQIKVMVRSLLKDEYKEDFMGIFTQDLIETFVSQTFEMKAIRQVESESDSNSRVCECELHGLKINVERTGLTDSPEWLQSVAYEVFIAEEDGDVWVQLLES